MATADSFGLFWNSDAGDRKYNTDSFEKWLKKFFTSGVFEGDLQVTASSGMTVQIDTGYSNQAGKVGLFEVVNRITLDAAHSSYPRIDTIVVERNDSDREISLKKVTGAYSGNTPVPTPRVWDETTGIYQLVLAQIYVGAGVSAITQADITDTRMETSLCGYITGTVEEIDFTQITAQFEAFLEAFEEDNYEEFDAWFQEMKDQLSTDAAGHLQNEIDDMQVVVDSHTSAISDLSTQVGAKQNATDNGLNTTSKQVVGAINEVDGNVDNLSTAVTNKHKVSRFSVSTSSWATDTTSQSGTTLYKKSISLNHVYVDSPSVDIGATGVLPTTAQQEAYNLLQYVTVDSAVPCLYLYASDIPTDSFYINVEGVD